jgi:transposase
MKEWVMIHKIKFLYDDGNGSSIREIARGLNLSRNTVRKYLRMDEAKISEVQEKRERQKVLDEYRDYIEHLLRTYSRLSSNKILKKLNNKVGDIKVSNRTIRRYISSLRETIPVKQSRYYEPVLDMIPGVQCQVDPGELRNVRIGGEDRTVYFAVFVLSYSRLMYLASSPVPIDTKIFIRMHDAAFRYFGGVTEECVYDQSKLVVIKETYRELELNQRFYQYATYAGFQIRACEGYDPESKGKVESGVKYVKNNALYGEVFSDWSELEAYLSDWLEETANVRRHGTTGKIPREIYEQDELPVMGRYFTPSIVMETSIPAKRRVDKTGLISWSSNKYSVPMAYQKSTVGVEQQGNTLYITDLENGNLIAEHTICREKGKIIKNSNHYRDHEKRITDLEESIRSKIGESLGTRICNLLQATSPKIYKDQLSGLLKVLAKYADPNMEVINRLATRPCLTASKADEYLEAYSLSRERPLPSSESKPRPCNEGLIKYADLTRIQGGDHVFH